MIDYLYFHTLDSTNDYLKAHHKDLSHFTVIHASHQTHGKGRLGKTWKDRYDAALFSILLKEAPKAEKLPMMTALVAYSLHRFLVHDLKHLKIKHPNDLLIGGKKLAGILVESIIIDTHVDALIIGIGINLNNDAFDHDLHDIATSFYLETNKKPDISDFIKRFVLYFKSDYEAYIDNHLEIQTYINTHLSTSS